MFVKDIDNRNDLRMITDSTDIQFYLDYLGIKDNYGCLFVNIEEGMLNECYGIESNIAFLHYRLWNLMEKEEK